MTVRFLSVLCDNGSPLTVTYNRKTVKQGGNVKPNKAIGKKKIDGVIAMIQALGMYLDTPHFANEIIAL